MSDKNMLAVLPKLTESQIKEVCGALGTTYPEDGGAGTIHYWLKPISFNELALMPRSKVLKAINCGFWPDIAKVIEETP